MQKSGKGEGRVFFAELEFKESQALFHRLAANSLPWIVHLPPALNIGSDGPLKIKHEDVVSVLPRRKGCKEGQPAMMAHCEAANMLACPSAQSGSPPVQTPGDVCFCVQMRHDNYGHHHWKADDMAAFLLDATGIKIEKVCHRLARGAQQKEL